MTYQTLWLWKDFLEGVKCICHTILKTKFKGANYHLVQKIYMKQNI